MAPHVAVIHEAILLEGREELKRPASALAWSGLAAGLSMGFSFVAEGLLTQALPDAPWRPLITKLGYSVGFLIVILGRQQLFTENTLTPMLPLFRKWDRATLLNVCRLWLVVLLSNTAGTFLFAWIVARTSLFDPSAQAAFVTLGMESLPGSFFSHFLRAIMAGWLIALLVWVLPFADTGRVTVIVIITYLIGLGKFDHVVAGSVKMLYVTLVGQATWGDFFTAFWFPALAGNIVGGVLLVAALNHAQVTSGKS